MLCLAALAIGSAVRAGELRVARLFCDGVVLQQEMKVPVWGWAKAGAEVTVSFNGRKASSTADKNGKWLAGLAPLEASSTPGRMTITAGDDTIEVNDILVGEVWLASGQSNMEWNLWLSAVYDQGECAPVPLILDARADAKKQILEARDPQMRFFRFPANMSPEEEWDDFRGDHDWMHDELRSPLRWRECKPTNPIEEFVNTGGFSAAGFYFAKKLREETGVPVGVIVSAKGGTTVQSWMSLEYLAKVKRGKEYIEEWQARAKKYAPDRDRLRTEFEERVEQWHKTHEGDHPEEPDDPFRNPLYPATHYNAMLTPLAPFAIRGVLWYQGENNYYSDYERDPNGYSDNMSRSYSQLLEAMIENWRDVFMNKDMQFYVVQLPPYERHKNEREWPNSSAWTLIRDEQRKTAARMDGVELICQIDNEEWDGSFGDYWPPLHTINKVDIGNRMADMALAKVHGKEGVVSGPLYKSYEITGSKIVVMFDEVGSGLMVGSKIKLGRGEPAEGDLKWFMIADADKKWFRARAKIVGKDEVEVLCDEVKEPVAVRYAWQINPYLVNFFNKEGLPASPFRTDDWYYRYEN